MSVIFIAIVAAGLVDLPTNADHILELLFFLLLEFSITRLLNLLLLLLMLYHDTVEYRLDHMYLHLDLLRGDVVEFVVGCGGVDGLGRLGMPRAPLHLRLDPPLHDLVNKV